MPRLIARPRTRARRTTILAAALTAACLLGAGCSDDGGSTGPPAPPDVAGTYRVTGTSTDRLTGAPGVRFEGTLTLTQPGGSIDLGGSATLTFTGGALGDASHTLTGSVAGNAHTIQTPQRSQVVSIGITESAASPYVAVILNGVVAAGGGLSGEHVTAAEWGAASVDDGGTWQATRQ